MEGCQRKYVLHFIMTKDTICCYVPYRKFLKIHFSEEFSVRKKKKKVASLNKLACFVELLSGRALYNLVLCGQPRGSALVFCLSNHALLRYPTASIGPASALGTCCVGDSVVPCSFIMNGSHRFWKWASCK